MEDRVAFLAWATEVVAEASERAKSMARQGVHPRIKQDDSVVTEVDGAIETFLRAEMEKRFPSHAILGEEQGYQEGQPGAPMWAIDPIDGTTNLANNLPLWCISLGLIEDGQATVGVIAAPMIGEFYAAGSGLGATLNGEPLPALAPGGPLGKDDAFAICTVSLRESDYPNAGKIRLLGSVALDLAFVASGKLKGCQCFGASAYDLVAGVCIAQEVGAPTVWLSNGEAYHAGNHASAGKADDAILAGTPEVTNFVRQLRAMR